MVIAKQRFMICIHQLMVYMCFYKISIIYDNKMTRYNGCIKCVTIKMYDGWYS